MDDFHSANKAGHNFETVLLRVYNAIVTTIGKGKGSFHVLLFYKIYSLCKNIAISKVLNKLQVFHFRSTVHTNTTRTVITHSCVLQKPTVLQQ